jgi:hypothetical protein
MAKKKRKPVNKKINEKSELGISLTSTALKNLNRITKETELSKSQLIEALVKGKIAIASPSAMQTLTFENTADNNNPEQTHQAKIKILNSLISSQEKNRHTDSIEAEKVLREQSNLIEKLKQKLIEQEKLTVEYKEKYINIIEENTLLTEQIKNQQNWVLHRENQFKQDQQQAQAQNRKNNDLQEQLADKVQIIKQLEQKNASYYSVNTIGEYKLNKWRDRTFY